ncbi:hypothetical protein [Algoriphagus limi]|uniref:DUF4145 domain-containing protein n=1 Tax=Algoriphagus limi TaxID=2975273 RepID=A0ABT2G1D8_9BACT|nr:hypothetical protein [Algoriphagus limi]MCS5488892.1 hypothetical protein [Algoriphagus limi]
MIGSEEFEIANTKLIVLKNSFESYDDQFERIQSYLSNDPDSAILRITAILEDIFKKIWNQVLQNSEPPSTLFEILQNDSIKQVIPNNILSRIHNLRILGNLSRHSSIDAPASTEDALISIHLLFTVMNWYRSQFFDLPELPEPVQAQLTFREYLKQMFTDYRTLSLILFQAIFCYGLFRYHEYLPSDLEAPFKYTYEGVFTNFGVSSSVFSMIYCMVLILVSSIFAWSIFKEFRKQGYISRIWSFELMFFVVFNGQFIFLAILDPFTVLW